ncbi:MAG: phage tail protein [Candidatus Brocadiaceae bacterium]
MKGEHHGTGISNTQISLSGGLGWGKNQFHRSDRTCYGEEKIEYRHSDSKDFNKIAMPGLIKNNNITLKRGKFEKDFDFNVWLDAVANERVGNRRDVVIRLLNEKHEPVAAWSATRCFPIKITAPDLKSDANEAAIESIEVAHEGLKLMKI